MKKQTPEALVLAACRQVLQARGIAFWRINTGMAKFKNDAGKRRVVKFGALGFSDLIACINGFFVAIECKAPKTGVQSDNQKDFEAEVRRGGGRYWLIDDSRKLEEMLRSFGK